jgi:hypothetical protein
MCSSALITANAAGEQAGFQTAGNLCTQHIGHSFSGKRNLW